MKLWVLMNSKTILSSSQQNQTLRRSVCALALQAAGCRAGKGLGMHEVLRGAWLNPSTSTCEFALFSAGSKVSLSLCLRKVESRQLGSTHFLPLPQIVQIIAQTSLHSCFGGSQCRDQLLLHCLLRRLRVIDLSLLAWNSLSTGGTMNVGRSLGSEHLLWVHAVAVGGGDAHADCPAGKSILRLVSKETS